MRHTFVHLYNHVSKIPIYVGESSLINKLLVQFSESRSWTPGTPRSCSWPSPRSRTSCPTGARTPCDPDVRTWTRTSRFCRRRIHGRAGSARWRSPDWRSPERCCRSGWSGCTLGTCSRLSVALTKWKEPSEVTQINQRFFHHLNTLMFSDKKTTHPPHFYFGSHFLLIENK